MPIEIIDEEEKLVREFEGGRITFRRVDQDFIDRVERKHTVRKGRDRAGNPVIEVNDVERRKDLIDHIIIDWENVNHPLSKEPVPCTRENKQRLPQRILVEIIEAAMDSVTVSEEELKNLPTT